MWHWKWAQNAHVQPGTPRYFAHFRLAWHPPETFFNSLLDADYFFSFIYHSASIHAWKLYVNA
jgi:hypothetical protein